MADATDDLITKQCEKTAEKLMGLNVMLVKLETNNSGREGRKRAIALE